MAKLGGLGVLIPSAVLLGLGLWNVLPIGSTANGVIAGLGVAGLVTAVLKMLKIA